MRTSIDHVREYETYDVDLPTLRDLGLRHFRGAIWEEIYIGHVDLDDSIIFVWVTGAPAQFWRFAIVDLGNYQTQLVTTGSGALRDHWPMIEELARGMYTVHTVSFDRQNP